jgi:hypothetical protein
VREFLLERAETAGDVQQPKFGSGAAYQLRLFSHRLLSFLLSSAAKCVSDDSDGSASALSVTFLAKASACGCAMALRLGATLCRLQLVLTPAFCTRQHMNARDGLTKPSTCATAVVSPTNSISTTSVALPVSAVSIRLYVDIRYARLRADGLPPQWCPWRVHPRDVLPTCAPLGLAGTPAAGKHVAGDRTPTLSHITPHRPCRRHP